MDLKTLIEKNKTKLIELFLYGFFGVCTTVINIVAFIVLSDVCHIYYLVSNALAWLIAVIFAFVTNKLFVFRSKSWEKSIWIKECITFISARLATGIFDMVFMYVTVSLIHMDKTIAKIIANIIVIIANYVLSKLWVFKKNNE